MTSMKTREDKITALLTVIEAVLDDYFADLHLPLSAEASKELARKLLSAIDTAHTPPTASGNAAVTARYVVEKHPTDDKWCIHDTSKGQFGYTNRYYTFENEAIEDCNRLNTESGKP